MAAVFTTAGDHVPITGVTFVELTGNKPGVEFRQYGPN
jgi:hypothetical protein